jgi:hypothetical protein
MTVPFNLPLLAVAAVATERALREEQEAEDQRCATLRRKQAQLRSLEDEPLLVDEPMIEQNYPITPPPELVQQWMTEAHDQPPGPDARVIATQAARWAADQELEACCEWVSQWCGRWSDGSRPEDGLRAARRPKPPTLKEQALAQLDAIQLDLDNSNIYGANTDTIRRALEQLND